MTGEDALGRGRPKLTKAQLRFLERLGTYSLNANTVNQHTFNMHKRMEAIGFTEIKFSPLFGRKEIVRTAAGAAEVQASKAASAGDVG